MDDALVTTALEAQMLMGHWGPGAHIAPDRTTITDWSWDVDRVRQQLHVPLDDLWEQRVLALEAHGLASWSFYAAPETDAWRDQPAEEWGALGITARGVLRLADLYGRPYVKLEESPAVLAHWKLVHAESEARLSAPYDRERVEREWPEQTILWKARLAELEGDDDARRD